MFALWRMDGATLSRTASEWYFIADLWACDVVVGALAVLPLYGTDKGLITAFGIPAEFYIDLLYPIHFRGDAPSCTALALSFDHSGRCPGLYQLYESAKYPYEV